MSHELSITRVIAATPDEVYEAWLDPQSLAQWMVPIPGGSTEAQIDPRVGCGFLIVMHGADASYPTRGEYLRLERPRLLEFSWYPDGDDRHKSIVTVELTPQGKTHTELKLHHRLFPCAEQVQGHREGWGRGLDSLAAWFTRKHS